jgi:protein dithiol oxidoreductase (disulfide-forming)
MKRVSIATLLACALAFGGCGKSDQPPPATQQQPAPTVQTDAAAPASTDAKAVADATAEQPAAPAPVESISETDDVTVDESAATVRPSLRLGGTASSAPTSSKFKEGTNYQKLVPAQPTSVAPGKIEVVEVFWYGCGHCFALDPSLETWKAKSKPAYVEFVRVPAMWNDTLRMHARVFYTADLLGKLDEVHTPIFREIHVQGNPLNTVEKVTEFFRSHGVSTDDFQKVFSSFAVESKLQRADSLNRRYRVESVPTFVVNGKYVTDVGLAGGEQQLLELIGELAASEHGS